MLCRTALYALTVWLLFAVGGVSALGQDSGAIAGVVVNTWDGSPLPGVVVTVRGTTLAAQTDAAGRYELKPVSVGEHVLRFSRPGFATVVVTDVRVFPGQTTTVNGNLRPEFYELEEYEVVAEEFTEQTAQILLERKESAALMDALGSDYLSRVGAGDAAEAVAKVAGATVVDGKFAVIRGLADRYTSATLNGGEVPSADPYRKAAQLDLIPADMISQLTVKKTFTPDQPGGFTGGAIDIGTKTFPEAFSLKLSAGAAYNSQATFNRDFLDYQGGKRDWLGFDDGTRALPDALARIQNPAALPVMYPNTPEGLAGAEQYRDLLRSFRTRQLGAVPGDAPPPDFNLAFSIGDTHTLVARRIGWFAAGSYDCEFMHYQGEQKRYTWPIVPAGTPVQPANIRADMSDTRSTMAVAWGGLANLALEVTPAHLLGFTFLYTQNADDVSRLRIGSASLANLTEGNTAYLNELHWTERSLRAFQFRGNHEFPALCNLELDWLVSFSTTTQDEPDYRLFNFIQTSGGTLNLAGSSGVPEPSGGPTRYFRNLQENNSTYKVDYALPVQLWHADPGRLKFGGYLSRSERTFLERTYTLRPGQQNFLEDPLAFPNNLLTDARLDFSVERHPRTGAVTGYRMRTTFADEIGGSRLNGLQEIPAAYGMFEMPLVGGLRLIGGARVERTLLEVDSASRLGGSGFNGIEQTDVLPAVGLVYEVITNMNVRLHFAQTVARPTFREFSRLRSYDVTGDEIFVGNPNLVMSAVDNYDLRWEWFRRPGEVLSLGGFYKRIANPIEKVALDARNNDNISYINSPSATVAGAEFEVRTSLDILAEALTGLSLGLNAAYIFSEVENLPQIKATKAEVGLDQATRPLYDQSPYIINADLTFDLPQTGTILTFAFNIAGERLYLVNNAGYDVFEQPAPRLDFFLTQRLGKHWKLKFSAKNILNPDIERIYGRAGEAIGQPLYSRSSKGRTFGLSLGYEF